MYNIELSNKNRAHVWTGYDSSSLQYVVFKFKKLPKHEDLIEFLDKQDDSIRKAKVKTINKDNDAITLEVYDFSLQGYRCFELEKGNLTVLSEIFDTNTSPAEEPSIHGFFRTQINNIVYNPKINKIYRGEKIKEQTLILYSPHPIDTCYHLLKEAVSAHYLFNDDRGLNGEVAKTYILLKKKKRVSCNMILYASMKDHLEGTKITGYFRIHPLITIFTYIWFTFMICMIATSIIPTWNREFFIHCIEILIVGTLLALLNKKSFRKEREYIKTFLMDALDAEEL